MPGRAQEQSAIPVIALDAWNSLAVLQHAPWLRRLLSAAILRQYGLSTSGHLVALNLGLKTVPVKRCRHRDGNVRLWAILHGLIDAAKQGVREHDRLSLARTMMQRCLVGRRTSSRLPGLIDLLIARPLVSADMVALRSRSRRGRHFGLSASSDCAR